MWPRKENVIEFDTYSLVRAIIEEMPAKQRKEVLEKAKVISTKPASLKYTALQQFYQEMTGKNPVGVTKQQMLEELAEL